MIAQRYRELAEWYCFVIKEISGIDALERTRRRDVVVARAIISHALESDGCGVSDLGELLGVHHSTIIHYRYRFNTIFAPGSDAEKELWEKFKKEI